MSSYTVFYWIHVGSYITWLIALAGSLFYASKVREASKATRKRTFMKRERLAANTGTYLGAIGILISGSVMASISDGPQWGWFSFHLHTWLAIKQSVFLLILLLVVLSMRRSRAFAKALKQEKSKGKQRENDAIGRRWSSAYRMSLAVYLLVAINTFLGLVKPYLLG